MDAPAGPGHTGAMGEEVYLHAGSPRTGTTSFQLFLELNAEAIRAQGFDLDYPSRDAAQKGTLALRFPAPRHDQESINRRLGKARANLAEVLRPGRPVILSEENIPGRMLDFHKGLFFPTAPLRAGFLARVLAPRRVARITLVLRPYAELFVSGFRKRAEDNWQRNFRHYRHRMSEFEGGWPEVIAALQAGLDPAEIVLLEFRRRAQAALAAEVCPGLDTTALVEPEADANVSLSDAALFALRERFEAGERYTPELFAEMRDRYADTPSERAFAQFTAEQKARLDARFAEDLDRLADMPGVVLKRG